MATPSGGSGTRWWRSRAFVQPLIVTIVGVVVSTVLYVAVVQFANGVSEGPCAYSPDTCGYVWMGRIGQAFALIPVYLVALLTTGFIWA